MNKKEGTVTIWIFRSGPFKPLKFKLPTRYAKIILASLLVIVVTFPFITLNYISQSVEVAKTTHLVAANIQKVEELEQQSQRLKEFDVKLRIIANLENAGDTNSFLAVGSVPPKSQEASRKAEANLQNDLSRMNTELDRLSTEAKFREKSFEELYSFLEGKKRQLSCTPSIWPARGWVTSGFGYRIDPFTGMHQLHDGIDIANRVGTPIIAPADGIVTRASNSVGFGLTVEISHGYGISTLYGHLSQVYVSVGQRVRRGVRIAAMGNSGRATGSHLHYRVSLNDVPINPINYLLN